MVVVGCFAKLAGTTIKGRIQMFEVLILLFCCGWFLYQATILMIEFIVDNKREDLK